jgi:hypothetical protein
MLAITYHETLIEQRLDVSLRARQRSAGQPGKLGES